MRNPLDESSDAQSLDENRLVGSLHVPASPIQFSLLERNLS